MAKLIAASIDLNKIDKLKIQSVDKQGNPFKNGAKYLNITISVNDEENQYGQDCSIQLEQTKEERTAKDPKVYLGNGKTVWSSEQDQQPTSDTSPQGDADDNSSDDLPF